MAEEKKKDKKKRPTAEKRELQNQKKYAINHAYKSSLRTRIRKFRQCVASKDAENVQQELSSVYSLLDKGVKRGVVKPNKAKRDKSRLATLAKNAI